MIRGFFYFALMLVGVSISVVFYLTIYLPCILKKHNVDWNTYCPVQFILDNNIIE